MSDTYTQGFNLFEEEEGTFRAIFRSSNEGILVVNQEGVIQMANPVGEKLFGYEKGELTGKTIDDLVPSNISRRHSSYRSIYNADPQPRKMGEGRELMGRKKDDSVFPLEVSLSNTVINDRLYVVAFVIDISRRKKAEDALKKSEEELILYATELEQRVKKRTEDLDRSIHQLEKMNDKLQKEVKDRKKAEDETRKALAKEKDLNELKSRFVSMASHEFRTPLSSVLSSVNLIKKYQERGDVEKIEKHTQRIRSSVKNLTDILNDFLSIGKLEEGKVDIVWERINLPEYTGNILTEIEGTLKANQKILVECPDKLEIDSDEKVLKHIFFNLISNASKYSSEDDVIEIRIENSDGKVEISFIDYGMGIPEDEQANLFERFFRAKNAFNIQGTGLGLNIVKKYVEVIGGNIIFKSKLNRGTTFTVTFPQYREK